MLRFARAPDGALGFDVRAALPGRGAWTCAAPSCVKKAVDKGGFERAFEAPVLAKGPDLQSTVRSVLENEALADLGILRRAGRLAAGRDDVARAFSEGHVAVVVLAADLSARSRDEVQTTLLRSGASTGTDAGTNAGTNGGTNASLVVVDGPAMAPIGAAIGRKPTGVLAALGGPASDRLVHDLRRLHSFSSSSLAEGPRQA